MRDDGVLEWCAHEEARLLAFPRAAVTRAGDAVVLDATGLDSGAIAPSFLTARAAHVHGLAVLRGHLDHAGTAALLLRSLLERGPDRWTDGAADSGTLSLYALDHVLLAAATGLAASIEPAEELLAVALERLDLRFWDPVLDRPVDRVDRSGAATAYRGMNSAMHLTEALFAVADATGDAVARERAVGLCRLAMEQAALRSMRLPEHYDAEWRPLPDHNRDDPDHAFRPYGSTPGHGFEWSRLIAQAAALPGTDGFAAGAGAFYERAVTDGWSGDDRDPVVYTVDWDGAPVSRRRLSWVTAEAFAAASVLSRVPGTASRAASDVALWRGVLQHRFVDRIRGSWINDLGHPDGPKPDLYHAYQSVLIPQVPVSTSLLRGCRPS